MKVVVTLGNDTPRAGVVIPLLKIALVGLAALAVVSRKDIQRYVRLRNM